MLRHRTARGRAFTLVEILCVVVILGIAGAIIAPQLNGRDDLKAASAARVVMADLVYAQNCAITYQKYYYVQFDRDHSRYTLLAAPGLTVVQHPVNQTPFIQRFGSGGSSALADSSLGDVAFTGASGTRTVLAFDEMGTPLAYNPADNTAEPLSGDSYVTITSGGYSLRVSVTPYTGQISVGTAP